MRVVRSCLDDFSTPLDPISKGCRLSPSVMLGAAKWGREKDTLWAPGMARIAFLLLTADGTSALAFPISRKETDSIMDCDCFNKDRRPDTSFRDASRSDLAARYFSCSFDSCFCMSDCASSNDDCCSASEATCSFRKSFISASKLDFSRFSEAFCLSFALIASFSESMSFICICKNFLCSSSWFIDSLCFLCNTSCSSAHSLNLAFCISFTRSFNKSISLCNVCFSRLAVSSLCSISTCFL
mmetsp:Transcript_4145/g.10524  ORF Transcript_4145/g.10524 Transcript_4145/m.10524 type:complete len:241 (+) Transcript_4145:1336-2058(+)